MKKNRWFLRTMLLLLISGLLTMTVSVAAEVGSSEDPLVTLSYLNETFLDTILKEVDEKIDARNNQIAQKLSGQEITGGSGTVDTFTVVTLSAGQTLTGDIGCEVMLRVGSAVCIAPSNPGLIDESSAAVLNNGGGLIQNHLYMMTIEGRGVQATAATTKLLVRGTYSIV